MSEEMPATAAKEEAKPKGGNGLLSLLIDFGPLLVFFLVYQISKSGDGAFAATRAAINGTGAFMIAIIAAVAFSKWKLGRVSPMLWLSAILVIGFGALTIWLNDPKFIQIKPTIIYAGFAVMLIGGWLMGRPLLRYLLQAAYDGLDETGWLKLSRNWGIFFAAMAVLNEALRLNLDFGTWLTVKAWVISGLSFVFAMTQIPMLLKHGLTLEDGEK